MRQSALPILLAAAMLAGCDGAPAPGASGATGAASGMAMEFRGQRPCADCDGIEAWLRLEQDGRKQPYRLIEHYRGGGRDRRFDDEGEWLAEGDLLRLRSSRGGERVYARMADGVLQARDMRGRPLPAAADDVMLPVIFDTAR